MSKWIKISDKEPPRAEKVLMYAPGMGVFISYQFCGYEYAVYDKNGKPFITEVRHWMPLPNPPADEEEIT